MKKFLVLCVSILCLVTVAFMTMFFLTSKESLTLKDSSWDNKSLIAGKDYEIDFVLSNAESDTNADNFSYQAETEGVLDFGEGKPIARDGSEKGQKIYTYKIHAQNPGTTKITFEFTSSKSEVTTNTIAVTVNDGSIDNPYPIFSVEDLKAIGNGDTFKLSDNYKLQNDIIAGDNWTPISGEFTGSFNGNGKTISQMNFTSSGIVGMFETIGATGSVYNLNIDQLTADGDYTKTGVVAVTNLGKIYGVNVTRATINNTNTTDNSINGGIVAINTNQSASSFGKISQTTFDGTITAKAGSTIGGIAGQNKGATIGYTYTTINTKLNSDDNTDLIIGGIAGLNKNENNVAGLIADSYSLASTNVTTATASKIGGTVGEHVYTDSAKAYTYGCFYISDNGFEKSVSNSEDIPTELGIVSNPDDINDGIYVAKGCTVNELKTKTNFVSYLDEDSSIISYDFRNVWNEPNSNSTPTLRTSSTQLYPVVGNLLASNQISDVLNLFRTSEMSKTSHRIIRDLDANGIVIDSDKIYQADGTTPITDVDMLSLDATTLTPEAFTTIKGNGNTISNFTIRISGENSGFYKQIINSRIENITLKPNKVVVSNNVSLANVYNLGILAGSSSFAILDNVTIDLSTTEFVVETSENMNSNGTTTFNFGSVLGTAKLSTLNSITVNSNEANVITYKFKDGSNFANTTYIGGIIGNAYNSDISNSRVNNLTISNELNYSCAVGGAVGIISQANLTTDIENTVINNVKLTSAVKTQLVSNNTIKGGYTGGIVGEISLDARKDGNHIFNCKTNSTLKGMIVGGVAGLTYGNINKVHTTTNATGWKVGGVSGLQLNYSTIKNCLIEGELIQSDELTNFSLEDSDNILINNSAEIAGISAVATMLFTTGDSDVAKQLAMDTCFINIKLSGRNAYKDSASIKRITGSTTMWIIDTSSGARSDFAFTASTNNIIFNNNIEGNNNAQSRPESKAFKGKYDYLEWTTDLHYSYNVSNFDNNYDRFNNFSTDIWEINAETGTITLKNLVA